MPAKSKPVPVVKTEAVAVPVAVAVAVAAPVVEVAESSTNTREDRYKSVLASIDSQLAVLKTLRTQAVSNYKADNAEFKNAQKSGRRRRAPVLAVATDNVVSVD